MTMSKCSDNCGNTHENVPGYPHVYDASTGLINETDLTGCDFLFAVSFAVAYVYGFELPIQVCAWTLDLRECIRFKGFLRWGALGVL